MQLSMSPRRTNLYAATYCRTFESMQLSMSPRRTNLYATMDCRAFKSMQWRCCLAIRICVRRWTERLKACNGDFASPYVSACDNGLLSA
eukprot:6196917-Pleurochrysis_carterae.AAC.2